jgi:DNA excision repair protein ERCC-4
VDRFEIPSGIPKHLERLGADVRLTMLEVGDYDVGGGTIVERKSVGDLHASVLAGRLWRQIGALRRSARYPFLLVEGRNLDFGPILPQSIRGICLSAQRLGVRLLRSADVTDSALWLFLLARQCQRQGRDRDRPIPAQRPQPPTPTEAAEAMLAAVPGLSAVSARALLAHFGNVAAVVAAGPHGWLAVPGIGPERARSLAETLSVAAVPVSHSQSDWE